MACLTCKTLCMFSARSFKGADTVLSRMPQTCTGDVHWPGAMHCKRPLKATHAPSQDANALNFHALVASGFGLCLLARSWCTRPLNRSFVCSRKVLCMEKRTVSKYVLPHSVPFSDCVKAMEKACCTDRTKLRATYLFTGHEAGASLTFFPSGIQQQYQQRQREHDRAHCCHNRLSK